MKYIVFGFLLVGCTQLDKPRPNKFLIKSEPIKFQECVERFLRIGVSPKESREICKEAYSKRE